MKNKKRVGAVPVSQSALLKNLQIDANKAILGGGRRAAKRRSSRDTRLNRPRSGGTDDTTDESPIAPLPRQFPRKKRRVPVTTVDSDEEYDQDSGSSSSSEEEEDDQDSDSGVGSDVSTETLSPRACAGRSPGAFVDDGGAFVDFRATKESLEEAEKENADLRKQLSLMEARLREARDARDATSTDKDTDGAGADAGCGGTGVQNGGENAPVTTESMSRFRLNVDTVVGPRPPPGETIPIPTEDVMLIEAWDNRTRPDAGRPPAKVLAWAPRVSLARSCLAGACPVATAGVMDVWARVQTRVHAAAVTEACTVLGLPSTVRSALVSQATKANGALTNAVSSVPATIIFTGDPSGGKSWLMGSIVAEALTASHPFVSSLTAVYGASNDTVGSRWTNVAERTIGNMFRVADTGRLFAKPSDAASFLGITAEVLVKAADSGNEVMKGVLDRVLANTPVEVPNVFTIISADELEWLASKQGSESVGDATHIVDTIKEALQRQRSSNMGMTLMIGSTNDLHTVDPAIRSRFTTVAVEMPDRKRVRLTVASLLRSVFHVTSAFGLFETVEVGYKGLDMLVETYLNVGKDLRRVARVVDSVRTRLCAPALSSSAPSPGSVPVFSSALSSVEDHMSKTQSTIRAFMSAFASKPAMSVAGAVKAAWGDDTGTCGTTGVHAVPLIPLSVLRTACDDCVTLHKRAEAHAAKGRADRDSKRTHHHIISPSPCAEDDETDEDNDDSDSDDDPDRMF